MDTFLAGNSTDECKEWNAVIETLEIEVLLL